MRLGALLEPALFTRLALPLSGQPPSEPKLSPADRTRRHLALPTFPRSDVHNATPKGWYVGRPSYHDERRERVMYALDPTERPKVALGSREWTAIAPTE